MAKGEH